jgi:PBP1b-binding outer membrane lipoprotein LpoB
MQRVTAVGLVLVVLLSGCSGGGMETEPSPQSTPDITTADLNTTFYETVYQTTMDEFSNTSRFSLTNNRTTNITTESGKGTYFQSFVYKIDRREEIKHYSTIEFTRNDTAGNGSTSLKRISSYQTNSTNYWYKRFPKENATQEGVSAKPSNRFISRIFDSNMFKLRGVVTQCLQYSLYKERFLLTDKSVDAISQSSGAISIWYNYTGRTAQGNTTIHHRLKVDRDYRLRGCQRTVLNENLGGANIVGSQNSGSTGFEKTTREVAVRYSSVNISEPGWVERAKSGGS